MESLLSWTENILGAASKQAEIWVGQYGYHAVVPTLLADPAGVPWAWVFLILFAGAAKLNVMGMLVYGFLVLSVFDHALYWVCLKGGRPLLNRIAIRFPKLGDALEKAEAAMLGSGIWAVTLGRYLPIVGRWVGAGAGFANVPFVRFAIFDAIGVGLTVIGFGLPAHLLGEQIMDEPWFPQAIAGTFIISTIATAFVIIWQAQKMRRNQRPVA